MVNYKSTIIAIFAGAIMISFLIAFGLMFQAHASLTPEQKAAAKREVDNAARADEVVAKAPVAVSGSNIYTTWNNASATFPGGAIFFTKSNDGGKTFANAMVLNPPNANPKIFVTRGNVSISASGSNVAVTWWTNETGKLNPVIRTSSDGGNTFGNLVRLNSTSGGIIK